VDGTPFGRYRLVELLGRGGMGEVWRAYDTAIDRVVALKVLPTNFADDPVFQERFRREAHAAAQLNEPHVVPIYDFGEIEGRLYVTMRLIQGRDLQTVLADRPLSPARAGGDHRAGGPGGAGRPQGGVGASGHQAVQHFARRQRLCVPDRFRDRARGRGDRIDEHRRDHRDVVVYGARAVSERHGRRARRHLCAGLCAV